MTPAVFAGAFVAGLTSGSLQVLPAFGASLVYQQGRYVPLWLPAVAMLAAYGVHGASILGPVGSIAVGFLGAGVLALALHRIVFRRLIDRAMALEALLAGIGISQIAESVAALYGDGLSQHYVALGRGPQLGTIAGLPLYAVDAVSSTLALLLVPALVFTLLRTHLGLRIRAVLVNRDLSETHQLPVARVDTVVIVTAGVLAAAGAVVRAARYDLQPSMMAQPGLSLVAAMVVAGAGNHVAAVLIAVGIEVLVAVVGSVPSLSAFQQAMPFVLLAGALLVRAWRRR